MELDKKDIEKALKKKGFKSEERDHTFWYFHYNGKKTSIFTFTSHGSGHKTYSGRLIGYLKRQLKFNSSNELRKFVQCPISEEKYIEILKSQGVIKD